MGVYRAAATLLSSLVVAQLSEGFKANFPPLKDVSVLVVGASGRIGENVCLKLSKQGFKVRAFVRNTDNLFPRKEDLGNGEIEIVVGDVLDKQSLEWGMEDCIACIDCHGSARLAQPRDAVVHPRHDKTKTHPYYINYLGTKNVLEAAQSAGVKRVVRITGLSVGLSAFNPFTYLLNFVISMSVKWHYEGEKAIREACKNGMSYTVVRPGSLTDKPRPKNSCLMLASDAKPTSMFKSKLMYTIGRQDVADLLVAAMQSKNAAGATLTCSWGNNAKGAQSWKGLLAKVGPDTSPLPKRLYFLSMVAWGGVTTSIFLAIGEKVAYFSNLVTMAKRRAMIKKLG